MSKPQRREPLFTREEREIPRRQLLTELRNLGIRDICDCWDTLLEVQHHQRSRYGIGSPLECNVCECLIYPETVIFTCDECGEPAISKKLLVFVEDDLYCEDCEE